MAGKGTKKKDGNGDKPEFAGFIQHSLRKEEKQAFDQWVVSAEEIAGMVDRLLDSGYRITLAYDSYHKAFQCSLICQSANDVNAGWCLTARAPDGMSAMYLALFKHFVLLGGDWSEFHHRQDELEEWA